MAAALDLGYQGRWMNRDGARSQDPDGAVPASISPITSISSLAELIELFPDER